MALPVVLRTHLRGTLASNPCSCYPPFSAVRRRLIHFALSLSLTHRFGSLLDGSIRTRPCHPQRFFLNLISLPLCRTGQIFFSKSTFRTDYHRHTLSAAEAFAGETLFDIKAKGRNGSAFSNRKSHKAAPQHWATTRAANNCAGQRLASLRTSRLQARVADLSFFVFPPISN